MKKLIISTFLLVILFFFVTKTSFAQQAVPKQSLTQEDYLKKNKRQKTAAWIFTGVGTSLIIITVASAAVDFFPSPGESETRGTVPSIIGLASIATGVHLFIASGKNKRRARSASVFIEMEKLPVLQQTVIRNYTYPAVGVKINL